MKTTINENIINESSIIPQNFRWRSSDGLASFRTNDELFINHESSCPYGSLGKPLDENFTQTLIYELDTSLTEIVDKHKRPDCPEAAYLSIKNEIRAYLKSVVKRNEKFVADWGNVLEALRIVCENAYSTQWLIACENNSVGDPRRTEFIHYNDEIIVNPFVAYETLRDEVNENNNLNYIKTKN